MAGVGRLLGSGHTIEWPAGTHSELELIRYRSENSVR